MTRLLTPLTTWIERSLPDADPEERGRAAVLVLCCLLVPFLAVLYRLVVPAPTEVLIVVGIALALVAIGPLALRLAKSIDAAIVFMVAGAATPVIGRVYLGQADVLDFLIWLTVVPVVGALVGRTMGFAVSVLVPAAMIVLVIVVYSFGWLEVGTRTPPVGFAFAALLTVVLTSALLLGYRISVQTARRRLARANQDLRKATVAAAQADRLATVGSLATGVAHGVNNPLQAALDGVRELELLLEHDGDAPTMRARGVTAEIGVALHQIRATVAALATFADPVEQGHGTIVDMDELVRQVVTAVRGAAGETADIRVRTDGLPAVRGHRNELAQVLMVLLRNAEQARDEARGPISIDVIGGRTPEGGAYVEVRDNGVGMSDEVLGRAFEPFYTTRGVGQGAGLGLPLARNVARHLGGSLELTSTLGSGTTARLSLPAKLTVELTDPGLKEPVPSGARILVVDDEPLPLRVIGRALSPTFEVELELSSERALQRLRQGETFDLIVSDLMMPDLTGDQLYVGAINVRPDLARRFVFITGAVLGGAQQERVRASGVAVIQKPFDRDELVEVVAHAIHVARRADRDAAPVRQDRTPTPA